METAISFWNLNVPATIDYVPSILHDNVLNTVTRQSTRWHHCTRCTLKTFCIHPVDRLLSYLTFMREMDQSEMVVELRRPQLSSPGPTLSIPVILALDSSTICTLPSIALFQLTLWRRPFIMQNRSNMTWRCWVSFPSDCRFRSTLELWILSLCGWVYILRQTVFHGLTIRSVHDHQHLFDLNPRFKGWSYLIIKHFTHHFMFCFVISFILSLDGNLSELLVTKRRKKAIR